MFKIVKGDETLGYVETPMFIRRKTDTGCFVPTDEENAEGVAYKSVAYRLFGRELIGVEETAMLVPIDDGEVAVATEQTAQQVSITEDALCDLDAQYAERVSTIEDVLCELDEGGEL